MTYPPRTVPEDCFDYYWIGDDHLLVYLIDVSGHGLEPALLSVSVHNMLRSGSLNDPDPAGTRSGFGRTEPAVPDGTAERPLLHRVVRGLRKVHPHAALHQRRRTTGLRVHDRDRKTPSPQRS